MNATVVELTPQKLAFRVLKLERLYAQLPRLACKQLCQEACGPIFIGAVEMLRLLAASGKRALFSRPGSFTCPLLADGLCSVYRYRPLICQLWGLTKAMACPHGCVPERWLSEDEAHTLLEEASWISSDEVVGILPEDPAERERLAVELREVRRRLHETMMEGVAKG